MRLFVRAPDFREAIARQRQHLARLLTAAVHRAGREQQQKLRDRTAPVLGRRVAHAWRCDVYPRPPATSTHPAARVYSRAQKIIDGWTRGTPIVATSRRFLAIPLPTTPRIRGRRPTPAAYSAAGYQLRVVRTKAGRLLLVAEAGGITPRGKPRKLRRNQRTGLVSVPLFLLVRSVTLRPVLFDWNAVADEGGRALALAVDAALGK